MHLPPLLTPPSSSRSHPPPSGQGDEEEDYGLPIWAGVLPLAERAGEAVPDPRLVDGIPLPPSAANFVRRRSGVWGPD